MRSLNKIILNITNQKSLWLVRSFLRKVKSRIIKKELIFVFVDSCTPEDSEEGLHYELFSKISNNVEISALFGLIDLKCARERLDNDEILICLFHNGILVSYGWGREQASLEFSYVDTVIELNKPVFYIYDCYTYQEFRGKGFYPRILRRLCKCASEQETYVACQSHNVSSVKGIMRAGFVLCRTIVLVDLYVYRFRFGFSPRGVNL